MTDLQTRHAVSLHNWRVPEEDGSKIGFSGSKRETRSERDAVAAADVDPMILNMSIG